MHNTTEAPRRFAGLSYALAVKQVLEDPSAGELLKARVREDSARDLLQAVSDSEVLAELQTKRSESIKSVYKVGVAEFMQASPLAGAADVVFGR